MKVICGLGNPGDRYRMTRHNVGFRVVDLLADRWTVSNGRVRDGAAVLEVTRPEPLDRVLLVKPMKYMNSSGPPLRSALSRTNAELSEDVLVVSDDFNLPLGRVRIRAGGSAGGHNGLRSIIAALGTDDFPRLRVGIGRGGRDVDHVLSLFKRSEEALVSEVIAVAADAVEAWLEDGTEAAMNRFNGIDLAAPVA